jgi:di/tricarboxylate transporter
MALATLSLEAEAASAELESSDVGIVELILTPRSEFIGKTLADLHFREKYECQVLALWRDGKPHLSLSSSLPLVYGDALLVQGPRAKLPVLAKDPDFLLLSEHRSAPRLSRKSVYSLGALLLLMFLPIVTGMPVHEAAFLSACVVVFTGAITTEQAYREIEWRVVFLLALIIPLGGAVEQFATLTPVMNAMKEVSGAVPPHRWFGGGDIFGACSVVARASRRHLAASLAHGAYPRKFTFFYAPNKLSG